MKSMAKKILELSQQECDEYNKLALSLGLKKVGKYLLGCCCPFHVEKTPSFYVNPKRETYYCFGCGKKGTIASLKKELDK